MKIPFSSNYTKGKKSMPRSKAEAIATAINNARNVPYGHIVSATDIDMAYPVQMCKEQGHEIYAFQYGDMTVLAWWSESEKTVRDVRFVCW